VEVTPVTSVDRVKIGNGKRGPVPAAIQQAYFDCVNGVTPDRHGWLTHVNAVAAMK
jgi:branched-chain amino acid aminotransferase